MVCMVSLPTCGLAKHLVDLLGSQLGQFQHYVRNSEKFVCTHNTLFGRPEDILVSIILLSTRVLLRDSLNLLSQHFVEDRMKLFSVS